MMQPVYFSKDNCDISSAYSKCFKYMRKIFRFEQMDFQFALWQIFYLFAAPQKLINLFKARKNAKYQYARDDPAFLVLFTATLCFTSVGFAVVLRLSFIQFIKFLLFVIAIDCIGLGILVASLFWYVTNAFMKPKNNMMDVEWGYCFDIHLNAFFPPLILLHFIQLFFYNGVISHDTYFALLLGNGFWFGSCFYYFYITFLGYNALQFLNNTRYFLISIPICAFIYILCFVNYLNLTQLVLDAYKYRVL
ncbi:unnamed protein product [Callosobruchus maculatus]|uniref:Uncharacterized protein n=1 Tax=Callosobruchus maculatus TaxID=64391 RepID=A0A653DE67_CALMS|nr:unnamed protein product [Callosobruchus maculatus]